MIFIWHEDANIVSFWFFFGYESEDSYKFWLEKACSMGLCKNLHMVNVRWIGWLWKVHHLAEMSEKLPLQSWQLQPLLLIFVLISSCQPISTWLTFNTTPQLLAELQGFTITGCFMKAMCIGNPSLSSLSLACCVMKWICMGSWSVARRNHFYYLSATLSVPLIYFFLIYLPFSCRERKLISSWKKTKLLFLILLLQGKNVINSWSWS